MRNLAIGVVGKIVSSGDRHGWSVKVVDDCQNTGGFLILEWSENPNTGFDSWVENRQAVEQFFEEQGWEIDWSRN